MTKPKKLPKIEVFNQFLKDSDWKPILKLFEEVVSLGINPKSIPRHYFSRYLFNKNNLKDSYPNKFLATLKPFFIHEADIYLVENNTIVALGSIVSKKFNTENVLIGGQPAWIKKTTSGIQTILN